MLPVRVLHILDGLKSGGAEAFIMNIYRNINREKIQFDFLLRNDKENVYLDEVKKLGGNIYLTSSFPKHFLKNFAELSVFIKHHPEYKIIHVHANSLIYVFPLILAKKNKMPCIILHSHNTRSINRLSNIIHRINRTYTNTLTTDNFACSSDAGKWMFGDSNFSVINNAIDAETFRYNPEVRKKMRESLKVEDKVVIGNVSRLAAQKNHLFLLRIFRKLYKKNKNYVLVLAGDGPQKEDIKQQIIDDEIRDAVILTGARKDVNQLLQAMDIFLFPSLYEGLPFTLIEAQAAGLPCVISDVITDEVVVTDIVEKVSLAQSEDFWAATVTKVHENSHRGDTYKQICEAGFDIKSTATWLEEFYCNNISGK